MEFPFFQFDFYGNRMVIALVAVLHVVINHPMAVGGSLLIACFERRGMITGDQRWDQLGYRVLFPCFIVTTSVGALTGVGIWLATALVNPAAIGSLLRVFFWAWFAEWLVFITEVVLILSYFLTWKTLVGAKKRWHLRIGYALAAFSWITMALITAILGFMMDPGSWHGSRSFLDAVFNPMYLPQLAFRTCLAMVMAGGMVLILLRWVTEPGSFRTDVVRMTGKWMTYWFLPMIISLWWYLDQAPREMLTRAPVALGTMAGSDRFFLIMTLLVAGLVACGYVALTSWRWPRAMPAWAYGIPIVVLVVVLGVFERTREFIRKPWVIGDYMYANGLRAEDYPLYAAEGVLRHHPYATVKEISDENRIQAGREVFMIACVTCHTTSPVGINSVHAKFTNMLGNGSWDPQGVSQIIATVHGSRTFMPPFPGTPAERRALAEWIVHQHDTVRPQAIATDSKTAAVRAQVQ